MSFLGSCLGVLISMVTVSNFLPLSHLVIDSQYIVVVSHSSLKQNNIEYPANVVDDCINSFFRFLFRYFLKALSSISDRAYMGL